MKAGFYQLNPTFGDKELNLTKVRNALQEKSFDLLVLPEFFATGYQFTSHNEVADLAEEIPHGNTTEALLEISKEKNIVLSFRFITIKKIQ